MRNQYHILNGDALLAYFPSTIIGEKIITRECLVDGIVAGDTLSEFYKTRASFINYEYGGQDYFEKVVQEFEKMQQIPEGSDINLWFEDDLFCQVNFWFVIHLLYNTEKEFQYFLVRPNVHNQYGFGGLSQEGLLDVFQKKLSLSEISTLAQLWEHYQKNELNQLSKIALALKKQYSFLLPAVQAHIDRQPIADNKGKPSEILKEIILEQGGEDFGSVFLEFNKRASIYGYGDTMVKRLFDELKNT